MARGYVYRLNPAGEAHLKQLLQRPLDWGYDTPPAPQILFRRACASRGCARPYEPTAMLLHRAASHAITASYGRLHRPRLLPAEVSALPSGRANWRASPPAEATDRGENP
jgi:hypothetical protein